MRHTIFISDLHLDEKHSLCTQVFSNFVNQDMTHVDAIYILGDFFHIWVGDDDDTPYYQTIKQQLKSLSDKGLPVYFLCGNHDFMIGKRFARETGCKLISEFTTINLYGDRVLLSHGDILCTLDKRHMRFRRFTQNWLFKNGMQLLSLDTRRKIAQGIRDNSMQYTQTLATTTMDVSSETVNQKLRKYKSKTLIHGHTHHPQAINFLLDGKPAERIVLGAWEQQGCMLKWYESGKRDMIFFN